MDLNFSHKGLTSFDASHLGRAPQDRSTNTSVATAAGSASGDSILAGLLERAPLVRGIDLSHNAIRMFVGGETLRHVTVLDLSHNALSVLNCNSLPPALVRLHLARNNLTELGDLGRHTPALLELDISFNAFTSSGLRGLPPSLTTLDLQGNEVDSIDALLPLRRLHRLNASANSLDTLDSIAALRDMPSVHHLELQDNGVMRGGNNKTINTNASSISNVSGGNGSASGTAAAAVAIAEMLPRLTTLNGAPQSQAAGNRNFKAQQAIAARASANTTTNTNTNGSFNASYSHPRYHSTSNSRALERSASRNSTGGGSGRQRPQQQSYVRSRSSDVGSGGRLTARTNATTAAPAPSMEVRLMEAKVAELRRLVAEAGARENQARYERGILTDQIRSCGGVIAAQAADLDALGREVAALLSTQEGLRGTVARADHAFEQTHASLVAQRVGAIGAGGKGAQ